MQIKVNSVNEGREYDSIVVDIDKQKTEIVFHKSNNVKQYEGKIVELTKDNDGKYCIAEVKPNNNLPKNKK